MPHEEREMLAQIRRFFENHGSSRFATWDEPDKLIVNRAGFRKKSTTCEDSYDFYVLTETYKQEICSGLDQSAVTRLLKQRGILVTGSDRAASTTRLPGMGPTKCYHITSRIMEA